MAFNHPHMLHPGPCLPYGRASTPCSRPSASPAAGPDLSPTCRNSSRLMGVPNATAALPQTPPAPRPSRLALRSNRALCSMSQHDDSKPLRRKRGCEGLNQQQKSQASPTGHKGF